MSQYSEMIASFVCYFVADNSSSENLQPLLKVSTTKPSGNKPSLMTCSKLLTNLNQF